MDFGVDRFGGHEHQRGVLGLACDQVFFGDVADMFHDIGAQTLRGEFLFIVRTCLVQRGHRFQWEFRVDAKRPRIWKEHHAIRAFA